MNGRPKQSRLINRNHRILRFYGARCIYCQEPAESVDHIVPVSRGGTDGLANKAPCCLRCNSEKGNKPIDEWLQICVDLGRAVDVSAIKDRIVYVEKVAALCQRARPGKSVHVADDRSLWPEWARKAMKAGFKAPKGWKPSMFEDEP